jgi:hypothetical protein
MKKKLYLFSALIIVILIAIVALQKPDRPQKQIETNDSALETAGISMEFSEVAKNDKDFYQITIKKKHKKPAETKKINPTNAKLQWIKSLLYMKTVSVSTMDQAMHDFLMDKNTNRIDKINALWAMLKDIGFSSQQGEYLLDSLATLLPIELTKDLIDVYNNKKLTTPIKVKLINMLAENTTIANPEVQDKERLSYIVEQIQEIQSFLKEDVLTSSDPDLLEGGLLAYANIAEPQDVQELVSSLSNSANGALIPDGMLNKVLTEAAMSTPQAQESMLPAILENMENDNFHDHKEQESFTQLMIEGANAGVFSEKSQHDVGNYLRSKEPMISVDDTDGADSLSKYYSWAEAASKIKNSGVSLEDIARHDTNPLKISSILLFADDKTIQKIKNSPDAENIRMRLEGALEDERLSDERKSTIKDALSSLSADPHQ